MKDYTELIKSSEAVLVEFYATWCPHCQRMMPVVEQVKDALKGEADVYQFDIDKNSELADSMKVTSIPTFIVYHDGEEVWRQSGETTAEILLDKVKQAEHA